ncbi:hypothetical protein HDU83_004502 [Entophlyctis luteolus]|nr:hypothetical protein HDU82_007567 [Entophlyctis luteolus]KAJ3354829.1 hypothetical protein HDU83_004502 [Entophlyctis luteolus]KAJ3393344.1 hypothetical protein HDU84_002139 [Entophlyctis sp. JEL0112]
MHASLLNPPSSSSLRARDSDALSRQQRFENAVLPISRNVSPAPGSEPDAKPRSAQAAATATEYVTRTLLAQDEVPAFLDHLHAVFHVPKPNGAMGAAREFFSDHWHYDDTRDLAGVQVAVTAQSLDKPLEIVSSVRVYDRRIHLSKSSPPLVTGGIGDVATNINHRGKSLAKKLMHMADVHMQENMGAKFGVLHAAPLAAPLYNSIGWAYVNYRNLLVTTRIADFVAGKTGCVNDISFKEHSSEMIIAKQLYERFAPSILGTFARPSNFYWENYVGKSSDVRKSIVRLLYTPDGKSTTEICVGDCVGYIIAMAMTFDLAQVEKSKLSSVTVTVSEFFIGKVKSFSTINGFEFEATEAAEYGSVLTELLFAAISKLLSPLSMYHDPEFAIKLVFPSAMLPEAVLDAVGPHNAPWATSRERSDESGWMFKVFEPFNLVSNANESVAITSGEDLARVLSSVSAGTSVVFEGCQGVVLKEGDDVFGFCKMDAF